MKRANPILLRAAFLSALVCNFAWQCDGICDGAAASDQQAADKVIYQNWHDQIRQRDIPVKIYLPRAGTAPFPIVIFSHGLGGSREAAVYLGDYWSQHGYLCVFVQHAGSDTSVWQSASQSGRQVVLEKLKAAANGQNLIERAQDIKFTIDELQRRNQSDPVLKGKLSLDQIAVGGHSFGAGTSLVIAGQRAGGSYSLEDKRVKSAMYLCPPVSRGAKVAADQAFGSIQIPGLLLTGTEDNSPIGETTAEERRIPFDAIKSQHQYLVIFDGADHATFGGRSFRPAKESDDFYHRMIEQVTTEFLNATLKHEQSAWQWLDSKQAVEYFGKAAVYERK
jgi:predicted dienelactone hydrolase